MRNRKECKVEFDSKNILKKNYNIISINNKYLLYNEEYRCILNSKELKIVNNFQNYLGNNLIDKMIKMKFLKYG